MKTHCGRGRKSKRWQTQSQERKERPRVDGTLGMVELFKEYLDHLNKYLYSFPVPCHDSSTVTITLRSKQSLQSGNIISQSIQKLT
jgi:hypothetical protein